MKIQIWQIPGLHPALPSGNLEYRMSRMMERDLVQRENMDRQRNLQKSILIRMNSAFLGVSSRKAEKGGATVLEVTKGSPAEKAGIKKGDIIIKSE